MKWGCLAILFAACTQAVAADDAPPKPETSIAELVAKLHSADFYDRERASTELAKAGVEAIPEIAQAVTAGDLEVAWRAIEVLEQHSASDDTAIAEAAQKELLALAKSPDSGIAGAADRALAGWRMGKRNMAIARLRELGAQVSDQNSGMVMMGGFGGPAMIRMAPIGVDFDMDAVALADVVVEEADVEFEEEAIEEEAPDDAAADAAGDAVAQVDEGDAPSLEPPVAVEEPTGEEAIGEEAIGEAEADSETIVDKVAADESVDEAEEEAEVDEARERLDLAVARAVEFRAAALMPAAGFVIDGEEGAAASDNYLATMYLDGSWSGGDEGLKHAAIADNIVMLSIQGAEVGDGAVEHLIKMKKLASFYVRYAKFSKEGLKKLHDARPEMMIMAMGEALVGISGDPHPKGFMVNTVNPDSGAEQAGVEIGDVVISCDGESIGSISDLTIEIFQRKVGDRVEMKVLRGEAEKTLTVTLGARD